MTIIAGFKSYEGIVLCADTQETLEHSKRKVPKLRFEPRNRHGFEEQKSVEELAVAFCGAGDGAFIDKLADNAWQEASVATGLDEACELIENSIKNTYREFGSIYQVGMCPEVQLIYGAKMYGKSRMFSATGPIVNEKFGYDCGGTGHYMANFLASRMYPGDHLPVHTCVILAAYILFQCKEHVEGCGGDSHIVVLREDESSGKVDWKRVEAITELLSRSDDEISGLLLRSADLTLPENKLKEEIDFVRDMIETFRFNQKAELRNWEAMKIGMLSKDEWTTDALGLPTPSVDQKSEPEK